VLSQDQIAVYGILDAPITARGGFDGALCAFMAIRDDRQQ
jgi:hypothetical protein